MSLTLRLLPYLALAAIALLTFGNSLAGYFLCDDLLHLGYLFRAFNGEAGLLLAPFYSPWLKDTSLYAFYRPLTELSLAWDYLLYGSHAVGYHITCVLWHIVNVWLLYYFVKTLTVVPAFYIAGQRERAGLAFFTAAIWAVYPTHCEAVSWIAARADLVACGFCFAALTMFAHNLSAKNKAAGKAMIIPTALIALPMVLGMLSKELAIAVPPTLFLLYLFDQGARRKSLFASAGAALRATLPYWSIGCVYLVLRGLALGDFIGGYLGSVGRTLNGSLAERWLYTESFFKVFHPFNDQLIAGDSPLRLALRIVWGFCGVMTIVSARTAGAVAAKYRLMAFALGWLLITLAPNLQVWNFSSTMAGGRIAYVPTAAIALLIVLAVYPLGASNLANHRQALAAKLAGLFTVSSLVIVFGIVTFINNAAWLEASESVRTIKGQLGELLDNLPEGQRLALINLPSHEKGAHSFTSFSILDNLLQPPLSEVDASQKVVVLDNQPCAYPRVNYGDVLNVAADKQNFQFLAWDYDQKKLVPVDTSYLSGAGAKAGPGHNNIAPKFTIDMHRYETGGMTYRFQIAPPAVPAAYQYLRVKLTLDSDARVDGTDKICYVWNNGPTNEDGDAQAFTVQLGPTPQPGRTTTYLIRLGENKLWLMSREVSSLQIFFPGVNDPKSSIDLEFCPEDISATIAPTLTGTAEGEPRGNAAISLKNLAGGHLKLAYDASKIPGAKSVKLEILPPYNYFDHFARKMYGPDFCPAKTKIFDSAALTGSFSLSRSDFPRAAIYQMRVGAVDTAGKIQGDFSEPLTVKVLD